ncbi:hypothetical protein Pan44_48410 [Caulifigura coniformis]|uniref:DUF1573 domain-containing protein n=1 Tax=Caulifigura coniformis TaxID=2527983 RepID=A0A517SKY7_9PLAN|nr:DUF1573 domain-containing protein [Caulifigura coniformis]QDT56781.1 hypothetical protein Pan44_48410 [Caulifigura coniformis]
MDRSRWILLSLVLSPCLASFVAWTSPAAPGAISGGHPKSALSFSQYAVNWKETRAVPSVRAHFNFRNTSDRPVKILSAKPSCGCVSANIVGFRSNAETAERYKLTYAPGEAGRIELALPTANEEAGRHEYTIAVAYNDGEDRKAELKFNVELPAKSVRLEPSELYFYQYGEPLSRTLKVIDDRNKVLDVTDVRIEYHRPRGQTPEVVSTDLAEATIEPSEITPQGRRATPIRIDVAGDIDPVEKIAHVVITTSDPDFKVLKVPMLIQPRPKKETPVQQSSVPFAPGPVTR